MKKLTIAFAVLMMLMGVTISIMKSMGIGPFASSEPAEEGAVEVSNEPPRFMDMPPLVISVFHGDKVATTIHIQLKLEVLGSDNEEKVSRIMPRLNDAFLRDLHAFIPRLLRKQNRVDVVIIKQRLQMIADKVAGKGTIGSVLVQSITDTAQSGGN
jgi:hypothetical protein